MTLEPLTLDLPGGITLRGVQGGRGRAHRVLALHGFPEGPFVWEPIAEALAGEAHFLAPALRGYLPSSMPHELAAYRPRQIVGDLVAAIEKIGAPLDLLVAHDWGGALAWNLAAAHPRLMRHLLIVNAPHPATFLRELRHSPEQQAASRYMHELCAAGAEMALAREDFAPLWRFFGDSPPWLDAALRERYRSTWSAGLGGMLNYYRSSPLRPPGSADDPLHRLELPSELTQVSVPTTVLWGERDHALLPGLLDGLEAYVAELRIVRVPDASHWLVHEQPQRLVAEIRRILGGC